MPDDLDVDTGDTDVEVVDHDAVPAAGRRRSKVAPFVALAIAAVFAVAFIAFAKSDPNKAERVETRWQDKVPPALVGPLETLAADGSTVEGTFDSTRRRGSWVVLNFFDLTCQPCVHEHPELVAFNGNLARADLGLDEIEFYSIVWGEQRSKSRDYLRDHDVTWGVVMDDGTISTQLGVARVPETWIIDPFGYVRVRLAGEVDAAGLTALMAQLQGVPVPSLPPADRQQGDGGGG